MLVVIVIGGALLGGVLSLRGGVGTASGGPETPAATLGAEEATPDEPSPPPRDDEAAEPPDLHDQTSVPRDRQTWDEPPAMQIDPAASYTATIETTLGAMELELFAADAPIAVNNFVFLAREGFYDGVIFHRVIEGFMIQGGDPTGTGRGGPGYTFEDEFDTVRQYGFERGNLAMANAGPNTNGSQFFIVHGDASHLATHTVFGRLMYGFDTLDAIATTPTGSGERPHDDIVILSVDITEEPA